MYPGRSAAEGCGTSRRALATPSHRAKTHAGWTYVKNKDASVTWTSPNGLTETVHPHDYRLGP